MSDLTTETFDTLETRKLRLREWIKEAQENLDLICREIRLRNQTAPHRAAPGAELLKALQHHCTITFDTNDALHELNALLNVLNKAYIVILKFRSCSVPSEIMPYLEAFDEAVIELNK